MMGGTLLTLWLLRGVLYGRMSSDVLIIETVGSAFIFLDSLSQRGFSVSCWVRGTVGGGVCLRLPKIHGLSFVVVQCSQQARPLIGWHKRHAGKQSRRICGIQSVWGSRYR